MNLKSKIINRKAIIGVIGLGYVGLPLAVEFAKAGFSVIGFEPDPKKEKLVNRGTNYISDVEQEELEQVVGSGRLRATRDFSELKKVDAVCICVPTPLDKNKQPDISYIESSADQIAKYIGKGRLIVLESTTYPGTTEEVIVPKLESTGLKAGRDFFLAFSPERVDPGNSKFKTHNIPKVIGGLTPRCNELTRLLYSAVVKDIFTVSSPRVAEMEKLLENIFRSVNIALVNELAMLCRKMKINIWEVIEAAKTKPYGYMPFYPGPGIGGHCIPLDPFYLSWKAKEYGITTRFIELAGEINDRMPEYVVRLVQDGLNSVKKSLKGAKILVLGAAYKKDIADIRESPGLKVIKNLHDREAEVRYNDPFVPQIVIDGSVLRSLSLSPSVLKNADCVVIATDHTSYDYASILKHAKLVVDTRNATSRLERLNERKVIRL